MAVTTPLAKLLRSGPVRFNGVAPLARIVPVLSMPAPAIVPAPWIQPPRLLTTLAVGVAKLNEPPFICTVPVFNMLSEKLLPALFVPLANRNCDVPLPTTVVPEL